MYTSIQQYIGIKLMDGLDLKLKLLTGKGVYTDGFNIKPKTIGEIVETGYTTHMSRAIFLSLDVDYFLKQLINTSAYMSLYESKHSLKPFEFFVSFSHGDFKNEFFGNLAYFLDVDVESISVDRITQNLNVKLSDDDTKPIDRESFDNIVKIIRLQNNLDSAKKEASDENPADEKARKLLEKMRKNREKIEEKKSEDSDPLDFYDIVSSVTTRSNSINKLNVNDITIYQLYDEFSRLGAIDTYENSVQATMMGAKLDNGIQHWSKPL